MAKAKEVVEALDLITPGRRVERELDAEGFAELNEEDLADLRPRKRRRTQAYLPNLSLAHSTQQPKESLYIGHEKVKASLGVADSLPPEPHTPEQVADLALATQVEVIEIPD